MESQRFRDRYRALLAELDTCIRALRQDVDACQLVRVPEPGFPERAAAGLRLCEELRRLLADGASAAGLSPPAWLDRDGLEAQHVGILAKLREAEAAARARRDQAERLRGLAALMAAQGDGARLSPRKERDMKEKRQRAAEELAEAAGRPQPPTLPGPAEGAAWLGWLAAFSDEKRQVYVEEIAVELPALADFLEIWVLPELVPPEPSAARPVLVPAGDAAPPAPSNPPLPAMAAPPGPGERAGPATHMAAESTAATPAAAAPSSDTPTPAAATVATSATPAPPTAATAAPPPPSATPSAAAAPPAAPPRATDTVPPRLPPDLLSFDAFRKAHFVDAAWRCVAAPFYTEDFAAQLRRELQRSLRGERSLAAGYLFARALEDLQQPLVFSADLHSAARLIEKREGVAAVDPERGAALQDALRPGPRPRVESPAWRLRLFLEALVPSYDLGDPVPPTLEWLVRDAHYAAPRLFHLVNGLFQVTPRQAGLAEQLAAQLRARPGDPVVAAPIERRLAEAREQLRATFRELRSAAGGKIQRTHCRNAWRRFMTAVEPLFQQLFPEQPDWDPARLRLDLAGLPALSQRFIEEGEVKFQDKGQWERAFTALRMEAVEVNELRAEQIALARRPSRSRPLPLEAAQALAAEPLSMRGEEALCQRLLQHLRDGAAIPDPLLLTSTDLQQRPRLRRLLPAGAQDVAAPLLPDPLVAAALLLVAPEPVAPPAIDAVHLKEQEHRQTLRALTEECRSLHLDELQPQLESIVEMSAAPPVDLEEAILREAWLARVVAAAQERCATTSTVRAQREAHLAAERQEQEQARSGARLRQTAFRQDAEQRFPDRRGALQTLLARRPQTGQLITDLITKWLNPIDGAPGFQHLRRLFCTLLFSGKLQDKSLFAYGSTFERSNEPFRIQTEPLRAFLEQGHNPSFLPQLHDFHELVVTTLNLAPETLALPARAAELVARQPRERRSLVLILAPGLPPQKRAAVQEALRRGRGGAGAILDDLDLCRLLNPGGPQPDFVIGLLEIALEQQPVRTIHPFRVGQGKNTHAEMFVGRGDETRELAESATYTRLFSGRKFGKTALLKNLERRYDGQALVSGLRLRILLLDMTGEETEVQVVHRLRQAFQDRFSDLTLPAPTGRPGDDLQALVDTFLRRHPGDSLLVVLDEIDTFVERQLDDYRREPNEKGLSWRMRALEESRDRNNIPRVRFLFSGYRVTYRSAGAFSNWGERLFLSPLPAEDAARLVVGPLSRIGIDAAEQAYAIAARCGYQPVVLLRFGEVLLERLGERLLDDEVPRVKPLDVATAFEDRRVQDAIQRVTWDNFEGNPRGGVLFGALVQLFAALPPFGGIAQADVALRVKLLELGLWTDVYPKAEAAGLESEDDELAFLRRHLRVLCDRGLLLQRDDLTYLRFPFHLPILKQGLSEELRKRLHDLRLSARTRPEDATATFFPRSRLAEWREFLQQRPAEGQLLPAALVVTSHWRESLHQTSRCVVAQMELPVTVQRPFSSYDAGRPPGLRDPRDEPPLALYEAPGGASAEALVQRRRNNRRPPPLLMGGADLLRWAVGYTAELIDVLPTYRLTEPSIERWFRLARGYSFDRPGAPNDLLRATSGIPFAVRAVDGLLRERAGPGPAHVRNEDLEAALQALPGALRDSARQLRAGPEAIRLAARELEILHMVAALRDQKIATAPDLRTLLKDLWEDWERDQAGLSRIARLRPETRGDQEALQVLAGLGLLPTDPKLRYAPFDALLPLAPDDALYALASGL